MTIVDNTTIYR